jgi:preprotein translocase subunit SecE
LIQTPFGGGSQLLEKFKLSHIKTFLTDVRGEMKKVSWPGKKEVYGTTIVVVVAVFFFGIYLGVVDALLQLGVDKLFKAIK